jgi:hypothetical protein
MRIELNTLNYCLSYLCLRFIRVLNMRGQDEAMRLSLCSPWYLWGHRPSWHPRSLWRAFTLVEVTLHVDSLPDTAAVAAESEQPAAPIL